jgi:hypothetical protein
MGHTANGQGHTRPLATDPAQRGREELLTDADCHVTDLQRLLRDGALRVAPPPPQRAEYRGETPIEGEGAVARWTALYDRARDLRAALCPWDGVARRQAQRAARSLFLYEHQLTPKTRRQARTSLWRRDRAEELPAFAERASWARCRCPACQSPQHLQAATRAARRAAVIARSA